MRLYKIATFNAPSPVDPLHLDYPHSGIGNSKSIAKNQAKVTPLTKTKRTTYRGRRQRTSARSSFRCFCFVPSQRSQRTRIVFVVFLSFLPLGFYLASSFVTDGTMIHFSLAPCSSRYTEHENCQSIAHGAPRASSLFDRSASPPRCYRFDSIPTHLPAAKRSPTSLASHSSHTNAPPFADLSRSRGGKRSGGLTTIGIGLVRPSGCS